MRSWMLLLYAATASAAGGWEESTRYQISWPSGLGLGEGQLSAQKESGQWKFALTLEAAIPGFKVVDTFRSTATDKLCSMEFAKDSLHGERKQQEKTVFRGTTATRSTEAGGGKTEFAVPACAHDALAYLFFVRQELAAGRTPGPQQIFFGAAYDIRLNRVGPERVTVAEVPTDTDHFKATVAGPKSRWEFDLYFAKDEARTLALVKVPFVMGSFALEWVR
jgi:hypothetical protein